MSQSKHSGTPDMHVEELFIAYYPDGTRAGEFPTKAEAQRFLEAWRTRRYLPAGTVVVNRAGIELTLTGGRAQHLGGRWYYETTDPNHGIWPDDIVRVCSVPKDGRADGSEAMTDSETIAMLTAAEQIADGLADLARAIYDRGERWKHALAAANAASAEMQEARRGAEHPPDDDIDWE